MAYAFDEYQKQCTSSKSSWELDPDLTFLAADVDASDEIPFDEALGSALDAEWEGILEADIEQDEYPIDFDAELPEDEDDPDAPISLDTLRRQTDIVAVDRLGNAARKETDFQFVIGEMDRLDRNRERRERYHEVLRGDVPLEYQMATNGYIFPESLNTPSRRLLTKGQFLDILYDCPYEMHDLTADSFLSRIVRDLKAEHKEVLYFLSLRLYSTARLAAVRGQSDRNIRKVRDTYTRKLQRQLYGHLCKKKEHSRSLSLREREFLDLYEAALMQTGKTTARVKRENKTLKRKKATLDDGKDG